MERWRQVFALEVGRKGRLIFAGAGSALALALVVFALILHDIEAVIGVAVGNALLLFVAVALIEHAAQTREAVSGLETKVDSVRTDLDRVLAERESPVIATYARIDEVPWESLFRQADSIEIVARFTDDLLANNRVALKEFFGTPTHVATLITLDPSDDPALEAAMRERDPSGDFYDLEYMRRRVANSARSLNAARRSARADESQLRVFYAGSLNYAGYCFSRRELILTSYPQFFDQTGRMPYVHVDLVRGPGYLRFWQHDLENLTNGDPVPLESLSATENG